MWVAGRTARHMGKAISTLWQHCIVNAITKNYFLLSEVVNPWIKLEKDYTQPGHFNRQMNNTITNEPWNHVQFVANFTVVHAMSKVLLFPFVAHSFSVLMWVLVVFLQISHNTCAFSFFICVTLYRFVALCSMYSLITLETL